MTAVVEGLGPWFRLQLMVCNEGATMVQHLRVRLPAAAGRVPVCRHALFHLSIQLVCTCGTKCSSH
jgi:hypothetical protein